MSYTFGSKLLCSEIDLADDDYDKDGLEGHFREKLVKREAESSIKRKEKSRRFEKKKCKGKKCKSSQNEKGVSRNIKKKGCKGNKCKSSQIKKGGQRKKHRKSLKTKSKSKGKRIRKTFKSKKPNERQTTDYSTCFPNIFKYTVRLKKARNIQNQFKRIDSSRTVISKKKGKKDDFSGTLAILVSALGGDKSAPKCSQSRTFNGDFTGSIKMQIIV